MRRDLEGAAETRAVGDLCCTTLGKMLDAKKQVGQLSPYLRNINVRWGAFDLSDVKQTHLTEVERSRLDVRAGDLMVCEGGEPGRCAVWQGGREEVAFQKALHRVRVKDTALLDPDFLALMLTEAITSGRNDELFTGTTIKHLPQEKLRTIQIPLPERPKQDESVARATWLTEQNGVVERQIEVAETRSISLRGALLRAAFEGRLTGQPSDLDRAEELATDSVHVSA